MQNSNPKQKFHYRCYQSAAIYKIQLGNDQTMNLLGITKYVAQSSKMILQLCSINGPTGIKLTKIQTLFRIKIVRVYLSVDDILASVYLVPVVPIAGTVYN